MKENKKKLEFLLEFIETVEAKASSIGSREIPFFMEMLPYMNHEYEPQIIAPPYIKDNIKLNGYYYDEDTNKLSLFVVDYFLDFDESSLPEISKTSVFELANKAKRFYANTSTIAINASSGLEAKDLAQLINEKKKELDEVDIYVLTTQFYFTNKPIEISIPGVDTVNVHVWDLDRIYHLSEAEQGIRDFVIRFEEEYNTSIQMMAVPKSEQLDDMYEFECFIGYIPAKLLAKVYDDLGPKLVERNVRSFLQARGGTNKGIRDTLKDPKQKEMFIAYNNGISSVAKGAEIECIGDTNLYNIKSLTSWQIVNGGQTTASIHQAYKNEVNLDNVYVQAKLTIIRVVDDSQEKYSLEDEIVSKISEYANTQNKINKSDLLANTRFMSDLEKFSRTIWIPSKDSRKEESKWYFERARGQYIVDKGRRKKGKEQNAFNKMYPSENVITKVELAKYFMSWEGYPHISSKGGEEAFKQFMNFNSHYWKQTSEDGEVKSIKNLDANDYKLLVARKILNAYVTEIVNNMGLKGYRANVIYYTVAMLKYLYEDQIDLMEVWQQQTLDEKWIRVTKIIAQNALDYLRESAGDRNVTQWAKQSACWDGFKEKSSKTLSQLV